MTVGLLRIRRPAGDAGAVVLAIVFPVRALFSAGPASPGGDIWRGWAVSAR
jgi:hypothetical protein